MCFTAHFPYLVNSLVLLGPGGILRRLPPEYTIIPFRFPSLFPRQHLANLVGKLLGVKTNRRFNPTSDKGIQEADITSAPSGHNPKPEQDSTPDLPNIVQWQYDHHQGFLHSFIDTTQHGPLMHQHKDWEKVGKIIRGDMSEDAEVGKVYKLYNSKILLIVGDQDTIVVGSEIAEDLKEVLGSTEHMLLATVPGTHSFPVPSSKHVLGHIRNFWGLGKDE